MKARTYPPEAIKLLADLFSGSQAAHHALLEGKFGELVLIPHYIIDESEKAFELLQAAKQHVIAAFLKAVDGEKAAIKFLLDSGAPQWAAVAGYTNGDKKALYWLERNNFPEYAELALRIEARLKKDSDDNAFKAILNPL